MPAPCFIIAEIGVNHNGSLETARTLVDAAAKAGADAAKFQTFRAEDLVLQGTQTVAYQKKMSGGDDQFNLLKKLELDEAAHRALFDHCASRGIEFMSTGFDVASLAALVQLGISRIKIPSGEITNTLLLLAAAETKLPIIVSTGMASMEEIHDCVEVIRTVWGRLGHHGDLTVLHCTSAYPTPFQDCNLAAIPAMAADLSERIGFSDHTAGITVPPLAVAAGARVVEKHVTLDRGMDGPDHAASIEPDELFRMVVAIREVETLLGDGVKAPRAVELEARTLVRKGLKFARDLEAGHMLDAGDFLVLRPETGLAPKHLPRLVGRKLAQPIAAFTPVEDRHLA
jgi:N-acetylneuraminate synthase/N,N'-diacetyllegionaminate synthase